MDLKRILKWDSKKISKEIENRKFEHIDICLNKEVEFKTKTTGFEEIELLHHALPELDYKKIESNANFFGRSFDYPILINGMTGGHEISKKINRVLAQLASEYNIPMEVGSQRAALENKDLIDTYRVARDISGEIFLIGNIGAGQLVDEYRINEIEACIEMIDANALAIHLNPLQELLQKGGNLNYENLLKKIQEIKKQIKIPIIVKETGCGLGNTDLKLLKSINIEYIDVCGAGGTSWATVEAYRYKNDSIMTSIANNFKNWGIPTIISTILAVKMGGFNVISSGGIRSGIDIAKAIACGAGMTGLALPFLKSAYNEDLKALETKMEILIKELKTCMLLTRSTNLDELKVAEKIFFGKIKQWLNFYQ
ncbi:MAG: type 2 isopentenyl-diphosphate Delta-isomerase [Promethearchaeota archaeon]